MTFLDPQAAAAIASAVDEPQPWHEGVSIEELRATAQTRAAAAPRESVLEVRDFTVGPAGIVVRGYRPVEAPQAVVLHAHGGGFVFNDIEVHDALARSLANRTGAWVLSIDYRRPPEHRFPAAVEDLDAVVAWLAAEGLAALGLGIQAPVAVHGDSAGGNLAVVAALRHPGRFAAVALVYPFLDPGMALESWCTAHEAFGQTEGAWYWEQYASCGADFDDPAMAPLRSPDLGTLPPTLVLSAEHDPCRDEGEKLAELASQAGAQVVAMRLLGAVHGFYRHPATFDVAEPVLRTVAGFLTMCLRDEASGTMDPCAFTSVPTTPASNSRST